MKEFDKQWQIIAGQSIPDAPMYWCQEGWKAALEWALGGAVYYCSINRCITSSRIKKELKDD